MLIWKMLNYASVGGDANSHPLNNPGSRTLSAIRNADTFDAIRNAARDRILILDGAMGTQIQQLGLGEGDFTGHGAGCACHIHSDKPQQGNNDLLNLTRPDAIEDIHYRYAMAGADIVETNTF